MLTMFLPASVKSILNVPSAELTDEQLDRVFTDLGLGKYHPEIRGAVLALLQDKGIDTASDLIKDPQALMQVGAFIKKFIPLPKPVGNCDFCGGPLVEDEGSIFCQQCGIHH